MNQQKHRQPSKQETSEDNAMTKFAPQPLLRPFRMGELLLPNRAVMAPLTRQRAANSGHVPTKLQAQYYAQRATAGVIISEGTAISPEGYGWVDTPGLWSAEQVSGWRIVTDAVHKAGGRIIAQLWHTGSISHSDLLNGALPVSASQVNPLQQSVTPTGRKPTVTPRSMTKKEVRQTATDYAKAAENAMEAGFDGAQVQANYLYLIPQFLNSATNLRTNMAVPSKTVPGFFSKCWKAFWRWLRPVQSARPLANALANCPTRPAKGISRAAYRAPAFGLALSLSISTATVE